MKIALNTELKLGDVTPNMTYYKYDNTRINDYYLNKEINDWVKGLGHNIDPSGKTYTFDVLKSNPERSATSIVGASFFTHMSNAYSSHLKFTINPHDFWFTIICEIARIVGDDPNKYRGLFTESEEKVSILVPGSDFLNTDLVCKALEDLIPGGSTKFLLDFSTSTPESRIATQAALLHMVKHYYSYMTYCCGLPAVKIGGTKEDWLSMEKQLDGMFPVEYAKLFTYCTQVRELIRDIVANTFNPDITEEQKVEFWKNVYSHNNVGSGGQKEISGWIKRLFTQRPTNRFEAYEQSMAVVPYKNLETGTEYLMLAGGFSAEADEEGFFETKYHTVVLKDKK